MGFHLHSFAGGSPAVPEAFVKETVLSPLNRHRCQQSVGHGCMHLESQFNSCVYAIMLVPQCFDSDSIGWNFEIGKHKPPVNSCFYLKIAVTLQKPFHMNLRISFSISEKKKKKFAVGISIAISLNL